MSSHLDAVLELSGDERSQYLTKLAATEPELADAIRTLLSATDRTEFASFLESGPNVVKTEATLVERRVGAYVIDAEIGRGGMGSVWRAHRADGRFEGNVAVKFVHASWVGRAGEQRFRIEGNLLAQLNHPNIARLIDAGVLDGAQPYLILEYVEGEPIDVYCEKHALDLNARINLFLGVLAAVSHAHSHLIVHRDLKPSNIFVAKDGTVKLLDFGIARLLNDDADLTKTGVAAMTPQFAAPEQLLGKPITTATDVHALGAVLYLLLTGKMAVSAKSSAELIRAITMEDPPRASSLAGIPNISARSLEGDIDNIIGKALKKSSAERYASAEAFADDLRRFLTDQPVLARADSAVYRVGKFVRRHRLGVTASALSAGFLLAAAVITFVQKIEADRQRDAARFETRSAQSANEFLNLLLLSDGGVNHGALTPAQRIDLGAQMLERQYPDDPRFAGRMLVQLSRQVIGEDKTRQTVDLDMRAYEFGKKAQDPELMALAQCVAAYAEGNAGILDRAPARLVEARRLLAQVRDPTMLIQVDCDQAESEVAFKRNDPANAERILREAMRKLERAGETYRTAYASMINDLTDILNEQSRLSEALALTRVAEETQVRYGRGGTVARLMSVQNEAILRANMGELREALALLDDVRNRRLAIQGSASEPLSLSVVYAGVLVRLGSLQQGLDRARAAADRAQSSGNAYWHDAALGTMCSAYLEQGHTADAEAVFKQMETALSGSGGTDVYLRGMLSQYRSEIELQRGNASTALENARAALKALGTDQGDKSEESREALDVAAKAEMLMAQPAEADALAQRALQIAEAVARGPETSANVGEALLTLAKVRIAEGRATESKLLLNRAVQSLTNGLGPDHRLTREADKLVHAAQG